MTTFVIATWFAQAVAPDPATGQAMWGWMQTAAGVAIALLSPALGAVADAGGRRRLMLGLCTLATAVFTAGLWFARPEAGSALYVLGCVGLATVSFEVGTVFYNSMLPDVARPGRMGRVSGLAWGLGYAGGLTCLVVCLFGLIQPDPGLFGFDREAGEPIRAAALLVAGWMVLFAWPVLAAMPDPAGKKSGWMASARTGLRDIREVLRGLRGRPDMLRFLLARLLYTDGLNTMFAFGAIFAAGVHGMSFQQVLIFGIAMNVSAGLGAALAGLAEDRVGSRRMVLVALWAMAAIGLAIVLVESTPVFWGLALVMGLFFGPAQAASRTLMARMAPPGEVAAHFGLFALSGRITGFLGPATLAAVTQASGSQRAGIATTVAFMALGAVLLMGVRERRGAAQ
ncbi:MFS transporter [Roseomonas xinghualingensis]|uniref:MFS transporter n=1 Tax=Roseomonas xinghualingensis TaxID=2986475 RepID=UPI00298E5405|nr:MFS transporter [Roseomonas sp. SXEYE001]